VLGTGISRAAIQGMAASYGNIGYMGLPLAIAFFGREAAVPAVLIFCFDNILQFTLTPMLAALGQGRARDLSAARLSVHVVRSIMSHPFIVATLLGGIASAVTYLQPEFATSVLEMPGVPVIVQLLEILSRAAGPVALFALGVTVGMRRFAGIGVEFPLLVGFKLVVHPVLVYSMLSLAGGIDPLWFHVALMMAALPTAANVFVLASHYRIYIEGASSSILVSTLLSAFTIPVLIYAIKNGLIP
jgi:malonate transporter